GDFVDFPAYGFVGWDAYLGFWKPDIDWRVQNFAIAGWTTQSIFDGLTKCLTEQTREQRTKFVTSNHIALEVGGNDFLNMTPTLIFMPWKYWSYTDPTTGKEVKGAVDVTLHNIKVLIYYFRHPLIDKDVLVMGNFPGLTYSPTLGNIGDYFDGVKSLGDVMYQKWNEKVGPIDVVANYQKQNLETLMDIAKEVLESTFYVATALFGSQVGETLDSFLDGIFPNKEKIPGAIEPFQTNAPDWYFKWVYHTYRNPTTA
ncbi:MAG: hypothetical protein KDK90_28985, partial [Leptospiraceae bacterium]|nr:hypothetical protein [Leptospiraceae bacterium]